MLDAVNVTVEALGIDLGDPGDHAGLVRLCQIVAQRIDDGIGVTDGLTELRRALNDLRHQANESHGARTGGVVEQLRAV